MSVSGFPRLQTQARASKIADSLKSAASFAGFDFGSGSVISIVLDLIPILVNCFRPDDGQQAKEYVVKRWNANLSNNEYGGYDKRLLKAVSRRAKDAAAKSKKSITWEQAEDIALKTLDDVRTGNAQQASLIIKENDFLLI